ncbi:hypothetical protein LXT21_00880 [Myxococcus sp. K38C18041901]|uniref:hypothetical protein n=1 Tax=Myxococcus guangdongensis TaxID=2906760 RepID=UPI0020A7CAFA|nr:hypothetical protein [Myxococcus guangdongensis]MCP3057324.1 hypothetical protein [Myxococcus guangdongensis]
MLRKSLLCAALMLVGCESEDKKPQDVESFRQGVPSKQMVEVSSPGPMGEEQGKTSAYYGEGELSGNYFLTATAAFSMNSATLSVLGLVAEIVKHPPSSIEGDIAVWGPHADPLDPISWRLTVQHKEGDTYSWVLDAKGRNAPDASFKTVLSGSHTAGVDGDGERLSGYGSGQFLVDFDNERGLPGNEEDVQPLATLEVRYARTGPDATASVEADLEYTDEQDLVTNTKYRFKQAPGAGGELDFVSQQDIDADPTRAQLERLAIKSRWERNGAGRSDIKLSGGDLFGEATVNECWDQGHMSTYYAASFNPVLGYGAVSACGSFSTAVYSSL